MKNLKALFLLLIGAIAMSLTLPWRRLVDRCAQLPYQHARLCHLHLV